ncbi:MAG TPA: hypothetical protein VK527_03635 [Candidatus Limnocylindrales bacterium]|nr:hypothetical protein [Candidatus Limnocylindrales bacterium]
MKPLRIFGGLALAALLAFAVSACQKKTETDMSQMNDTTQVSQGYGTETPPQASDPGAQGATLPEMDRPAAKPRTTIKHKSTSGTSETSSGQATYAEKHTTEIPAGTTLDVEMITPLDTRTTNIGDKIEAKLASPITRDGVVLAEAGALVTGEVTDVQRASKSKSKEDRASLALEFNSIETVDGTKRLHATVANAEGKLIAKSTSTRDKLLIGGGALAGAIAGKVAGGSTKSTIIGAVGGAAVGTGAVLMTKGHELGIDEGAKVSLRVDQPIVIVER